MSSREDCCSGMNAQQQHTLNINPTTQFNNVKQQRDKTQTIYRVSQTNFFIWFIHGSPDFIVGLGPNQNFLNIMKISNKEASNSTGPCTDQILRTWFSLCRRS